MNDNRWYLSSAPIVRALVHLCVPMAAALIVSAVYNVVDAGFVGSLHDPTLLAALMFGVPLLGLVMAVGGMFGAGGAPPSRGCSAPRRTARRRRTGSSASRRSRCGARCSPAWWWAGSACCCCTRSSRCWAPTPRPCPRPARSSP